MQDLRVEINHIELQNDLGVFGKSAIHMQK